MRKLCLAAAVALLFLAPYRATADNLTLILSAGASSLTNTTAQQLKPFLQKNHPDEPSVIIQHVPGAQGAIGCRHLLAAKPDGATIGLFVIGSAQLIMGGHAAFAEAGCDLSKLTSLGASSTPTRVLLVNRKLAQRREDVALLKGRNETIHVASSGGVNIVVAGLLLESLGIAYRNTNGYAGMGETVRAAESGEMHMAVTSADAYNPHQALTALCQYGVIGEDGQLIADGQVRDAEGRSVPLCHELVRGEQAVQISQIARMIVLGNPYFASSSLSESATAKLRKALKDAHADPGFRQIAAKTGIGTNFTEGAEFQKTLRNLHEYAVTQKLRAVVERISPPQ